MTKRLCVAGLPLQVTDEALENFFSAHGTVESATVRINRTSGLPDGFGFVEMSKNSEAQEAIQKLNGTKLEGQIVKVHEARPRLVSLHSKRKDSTVWDIQHLYPTREPLEPVIKFAWAILHRAVLDISSSSSSEGRYYNDAIEWFLSDKKDPGSLVWVCDILRVQPWILHKWLSIYRQSTSRQREHLVKELLRILRPGVN